LTGGEINRNKIFEAEEISFGDALPKNLTYDEYGFLDKNKQNTKKQK
jgi:hypothetical protein